MKRENLEKEQETVAWEGMKAMILSKVAPYFSNFRCHLKKLKTNILTPSGTSGTVISYKAKNEKCKYEAIYYM